MSDTITVVGNIATNPETRTAGPVPVTSFRLATSERRPDGRGGWIDGHTNYYTVSAFRTLGENAFVSLRRGERVIVSGRLRLKEWSASDGSKGRSMEIDADALGHDLRFGTTVYHRSARSESPGGAEPAEPTGATESGWAATSQGGWAAPGVHDEADAADGRFGRADASDGAIASIAGDFTESGEGSDADEHRTPALVGADTPF